MHYQTNYTRGFCCQCGITIESISENKENTCDNCMSLKLDITDGIRKVVHLYYCRFCDRYLQPPNNWVHCDPESRELMALILKKLTNLKNVRLVNSEFLYTEPHSGQLKLELTVQKDISSTKITEQRFEVFAKQIRQMCVDCHRIEAKDYWKAVVQVRQHVSHKKTFFFLEQVILKKNAHKMCTKIDAQKDGIDFFFPTKQTACKFINFISAYVPSRYTVSEELISHDTHSNTYNYKHSYSFEIVPICKDDIVCIPNSMRKALGQVNQLLICTRVTNIIHLLDPFTLRTFEIDVNAYYRHPFYAIASFKSFTKFCVLDVEPATITTPRGLKKSNQIEKDSKYELADITLMKISDFDYNYGDNQTICKSHLGKIVSPGDEILGFDFASSNINDSNFEKIDSNLIPDVLIVKKFYADRKTRRANRNWKIKRMKKEEQLSIQTSRNVSDSENDLEEFMQDIEEDPEIRKGINVYRDDSKISSTTTLNPHLPIIKLEEMLEDLHI